MTTGALCSWRHPVIIASATDKLTDMHLKSLYVEKPEVPSLHAQPKQRHAMLSFSCMVLAKYVRGCVFRCVRSGAMLVMVGEVDDSDVS